MSDQRFDKMIRRVAKGFYWDHIEEVRHAVSLGTIEHLISEVESKRPDIVTVKFRIEAMASAVRQGYAE